MLDPIICPQCVQPNEPGRKLCWKCMRSLVIPPTEGDYARFFELKGNWDRDDLKTAFRKLARKYHPDVNHGDREADSYFKYVNAGYEILIHLENNKQNGASSAKPSDAPSAR